MRGFSVSILYILVLVSGASHAALIADYTADYLAGTAQDQTRAARSNDGWNYMWNRNGAIGAEGGYVPLQWSTGSTHYNAGGGTTPRAETDGYYVFTSSGGGHPGRGQNDNNSGGEERFMISAYTIQNNEQGDIYITNSSVRHSSCGSNGQVLRVYVNNTLMNTVAVVDDTAVTATFNGYLGDLAVGDRVYVCVGANNSDGCDGFALQYRLEVRPRAAAQTVTLPENSPPVSPSSQTVTLAAIPPIGGLTYTIATQPANGTLTPNGGASYRYTPAANYSGADAFTFSVTEAGNTTATATVSINVTPVNSGAPVANADSASTPDSQPVTINVKANDVTFDPPLTVSIVTQPQHGTVVVNAGGSVTYSPVAGYSGPDSFTYRGTDFEGDAADATVSITVTPVAPFITSPLLVSALEGLQFRYTITATGTLPMAYSVAGLPNGLSLVGSEIVGFVVPGSYVLNLTASNAAGSDLITLVISALPLRPDVDTDGDGYPDEMEVGVGSSPVSAASTPLTILKNAAGGLPAGSPNGFPAQADPFFSARTGVSIRLNFSSQDANRDSITLNGTLPVPPGFSAQLQPLVIMVGGATFSGVLDLKSNYTNTDRSVRMKIANSRPTIAGGNLAVSLKAKGVYSSFLADEGLNNADVASTPRIAVFVLVGARYYKIIADVSYKARLNKSGTAKSILRQ